ncbi:MAG: hypothetical protein ACLTYW_08395 [Collinsella sp.]
MLFGGVTTAAQDTLSHRRARGRAPSERIDVVTTTVGRSRKAALSASRSPATSNTAPSTSR